MGAETHVPESPLWLALRSAVAYASHRYGVAAIRYMVHVSDTTTDNGTRKITARVIPEGAQVHTDQDENGAASWKAALDILATYDCQNDVLVYWHMAGGGVLCTYKKAQVPPPQNVLDHLAA